MRIVQYIARFFTRDDAVVNVALDWSRAFAELGHDVILAHGTPDVWRTEFAPGVEAVYLPHAGVGKDVVPLQFGKILRPGDVLIMHTDWRLSNLVAAVAARRKGVPYIIVPHGEYYPQQLRKVDRLGSVRLAVERQLVRRSLGVHVFWPTEVPLVQQFAGDVRCFVAPTGVQLTDDRWQGGGGYISWIGRYVVDHKGLDILARAMARLEPSKRPVIQLHGIDQQGHLAGLKELVESLGISASMRLGGGIVGADKQAFLANADAYVHPSRWECHSVALLENLALGVPSLVSLGNHCAPTLRDAGAALVAEPDETALAEGLERLMNADRQQLSDAARAFVRDNLEWKTTATTFLESVRAALA